MRPRDRAEQFGNGRLRALNTSGRAVRRRAVSNNGKVIPPAPFIGNGPCAPRCWPMPGHRTQAEIMAAEARA